MKFKCILIESNTERHGIKLIHPVKGANQSDLKNREAKGKTVEGHNLDLQIAEVTPVKLRDKPLSLSQGQSKRTPVTKEYHKIADTRILY